jgi:hypothetical protein
MTAQLLHPGDFLPHAAFSQQHSIQSTSAEDAYTDKAGGCATWHAELPPPKTDALKCARCGSELFLLTQLYLPAKANPVCGATALERHIYVLACNKAECSASGETGVFRVLRLAVNWDEEGPSYNPHKDIAAASSSAAASAAAIPPPKPAAAVASSVASADEWGASAAWSDDEDTSAASKSKPKKTAKSDEDDDTALQALLAQQSLQQENSRTQKAAQAEKAAKKAETKAAKEAERAQALQDLQQKVAEARQAAETADAAVAASASSTAASSVEPAAFAAASYFTPFYLAWTDEPSAATLDHSPAERLLRQYEAEVAADGDADERADWEAVRSASGAVRRSSASSAESSGHDSEDDEPERREDETQAFLDRIARMPEQCVRYYEPHTQAAARSALYSSRKELAFRNAAPKNPSLLCTMCKSQRVLEVQLCSKLLFELKVESADLRDPGQDWTTLDVYTCPKACWTNEYVEEVVHVQPPL